MTDGRAKEPAAFVGQIEKPARPALWSALDIGIAQVARDPNASLRAAVLLGSSTQGTRIAARRRAGSQGFIHFF
jgi:hypothetical protein